MQRQNRFNLCRPPVAGEISFCGKAALYYFLEKAFDFVPRKVVWWAMRKLGVEEWIVKLVQGMYENVRSHI